MILLSKTRLNISSSLFSLSSIFESEKNRLLLKFLIFISNNFILFTNLDILTIRVLFI